MIEQRFDAAGGVGTADVARHGIRSLSRIAGLLLLAYIVSTLVVRMDVYFVVLAGIAIAAALILSRRFEFGLLLYFLIAPFNRGNSPAVLGAGASYDAGIMPSQMGLAVLSVFWAVSQFFGGGIRIVKTRLNAPFLAFFGVAIASIAAAGFIWDADVQRFDNQLLYQVSEVGIWALCAAAFFLTANSIKGKGWIAALYWPVVIVALYVSYFQFTRAEMPIRISHNVFIVAYAATLTTARLVFRKESMGVKLALGLLLALFLTAAFYNRVWVSGWLSTSLGVMVVLVLYSRRLFAALAVAALFMLFIYPAYFHSIYDDSRHEGDLDRITMWGDAARMAGNTNPLLGIGPGDYMTYGRKYGSSWYGENTYTTPHSNYPQMIAELGILGIAAFLWLLVAGVRTGYDSIRGNPGQLKWFAAGATAIFASIAVTSLVGDYILPSRVNGGIWTFSTSVFPWLLLGAAVAGAQPEEQEPEAVI